MTAANLIQPDTPAAEPALRVRPAQASDHVPLTFFFDTALRRDYFMRRGQLEDLLTGRHHQVYIAEIDSVLVGVAITTCGSRLINALVHPAYRGLGIGRALIERSGASEVRAKLDMSTGDPTGFYEALGFRTTGERNAKGNIELLRRGVRGSAPASPAARAQRRRPAASCAQTKVTTGSVASAPRSGCSTVELVSPCAAAAGRRRERQKVRIA